MPVNAPQPVAAYFDATNKHDIDAMLALFDENSRVEDEGQERYGRAQIRAWMEEAVRKYRFSVEIQDVRDVRGETVVAGLVSGDFPGSPVVLRHAFTLRGAKIARLEIES
jgi:ketosteroid isomerase-like protein